MPLIDFDETRFSEFGPDPVNPNLPFVFCSHQDTNILDDSGPTGTQFLIAQGNMFVDSDRGHLFFTPIGEGGCDRDHEFTKLVISFNTPQRFIRILLGSDFAGPDIPLRVNFFEEQGPPDGTPPLQTIELAFDNFPPVVFNQAGPGVREVIVTSAMAENLIYEIEFSDTARDSLHGVAAAFDGSGSMAQHTKWEAMIEAGSLFYDLYKVLGDPADTFAGVTFRAGCGDPGLGGLEIIERPASGPLSASVDLPSLFSADAPQGCTPIGEALVAAGTRVREMSVFRTVLLLTDGINNRGRSVVEADNSDELEGITVHTVGVGSEAEIDPIAISWLADNHDGQFRQTTNPAEISDFFVQTLAQTLGKAELAGDLGDGNIIIGPGTTKAVFLIAWDVGGPQVDFDLRGPGGTEFSSAAPTPDGPVSDISYQRGSGNSFHSFFVVEGTDLGGLWTFVNTPAGTRQIVVEDLSLRVQWSISPKLGLTGERIRIRARITQDGKPFEGQAQVKARISSPDESIGEVLAVGGKGFKASRQSVDVNLRQTLAARGLKALKLKKFSKRTQDSQPFKKVGPGLYELIFSDTELDGVYRFDLEAKSMSMRPIFHRRISLFSVLVSAPASEANTVRLESISPGIFRATVRPATKKKRPLGPFLGPWLSLKAARGRLIGKLSDHLDGDYSQILSWDGKGLPSFSLELFGRRSGFTKLAKPQVNPNAKTRSGKKKK